MAEKHAESFYTVWIQKELGKVVLEVGNRLTEPDAEGNAEDYLLTNDCEYVDPERRFKMIMTTDTAKRLAEHITLALEKLE